MSHRPHAPHRPLHTINKPQLYTLTCPPPKPTRASDGTADRRAMRFARRYSTELGEFRAWTAKADRAVKFSGVEADDVLEKVSGHRRPTTPMFVKYNYFCNPMCQPPWTISGRSAAAGDLQLAATELTEIAHAVHALPSTTRPLANHHPTPHKRRPATQRPTPFHFCLEHTFDPSAHWPLRRR